MKTERPVPFSTLAYSRLLQHPCRNIQIVRQEVGTDKRLILGQKRKPPSVPTERGCLSLPR